MRFNQLIKNHKQFLDIVLVHKGNEYMMNSMVLSSVSNMFRCRITSGFSGNRIDVPSLSGNFRELLGIFYGESITINADNCRFLNYMAVFFDIDSLKAKTQSIMVSTNTFSNIALHADNLLSIGEDPHEEIILLAQNITKNVTDPCIKVLSSDLLMKVIRSNHLPAIEIPQVINSIVEVDPKKFIILYHFMPEILQHPECMFAYLSYSQRDESLKNSACINCLRNKNSVNTLSIIQYPVYEAGFIRTNMKSLKKENLVSNPIYSMQSSSILNDSCSLHKLLLGESPIFSSNGSFNESITVILTRGVFKLTHYSITSCPDSMMGYFPYSWVIEGQRNINGKWYIIDEVNSDKSLLAPSSCVTFRVKTVPQSFQSLRFRQIEAFHPTNKRLVLSWIDLFGIYNP